MTDMTHNIMKNGLWMIAVIVLLTTCVAVPVRPRRQVQLHDGIPLQDQLQSAEYDDVAAQTSVTDDTSHNAPDNASHPALPADHHGHIDGLHGDISETGSGHGSSQSGLHGDSSETGSGHGPSQTGLHGESSETGSGHGSSQTGAVHDLDLNEDKTNPDSNPDSSTGGEQALVDHDLDNHQNLPENHPVDENGELHPEVQGHSTRSPQSELRTTSVRQIHGQSGVRTTSVRPVHGQIGIRTTSGRPMNGQSELTSISTNHSHGRRGIEGDTEMLNRSNSQHFLLSALDLDTERLTRVNGSTPGGQNGSVPLNTGEQILSSVHTTRLLPAMVTSTTEQVTVKAIVAHNGETEQSVHEQISDSGGGSHVAVDGIDGEHHHIATQNASAGEGHIAMLPGEHAEQGQGHEQHISEQTESDNHHSGVDIPIDKGEHPHTDHDQEPVDPVQPRHTVNPQTTPEHHEHVPVVEPPVSSTPKLVILPTPAQPEQHSSRENSEPINPVNHEGHSGEISSQGETNHEGHGHTEQGEGHPDMSGGEHENIPDHITPGEGHIIEYITEEPGTESGELDKPSKDDSKTEGGKVNPASGQPEILPVSESSHLVEPDSVTTTISYEISNTITPSFDIGVSQTGHSLYSSVTAYLPPSLVITDSSYNTDSLFVSRASDSQPLSSIGLNSKVIESGESYPSFITSSEVIRPSSSQLAVTESIYPTPEIVNAQSKSSSAILFPSSESLQLSASIVRPASVIISSSPIESPASIISLSVSVNTEQQTSGPVTSSPIVPSSVSAATESSLPSRTSPVAPDHGFLTTTDKPETIPVLTTLITTKRKDEQNRTTVLTTTKKTNTVKVTEKPENASSTFRTPVVSTFSQTTRRPVPIRTTQRSDQSTPPAVYIEIELRMQWFEFCSERPQFITEIVQIMESKETVYVSEEQLRLATENCGSVNAIMMGTGLDTIMIRLYIVDIDGKIDIRLTMVAGDVIYKGFQESNYFKDKILSVQYYPTRSTSLPDLREERKITPPGVTMVIVIAAVGGVCCVALIILQVLLHRRVKAKKKLTSFIGARASVQSMDHVALGVIPKSRPNSGYWNPGLDDTMELPEPDEHSHIMNFSSLANFCMDTSKIHAEFQAIPFDNPDLTSVPVGEEDKNRFANVLPHKHTRVKLKQEENDKSDYINANYVNGYMGEKNVYIATQSPLVNTVEDFWKMVWQQQSRAILMLNPVTQHGKPKQSTCYWPDSLETDNQREYGDYVVTLKKRDIQHDYVDCTLEIMDIERNLKRELHHFWLQCWPDTGSPEPLAFVKFVLDTRPHYENTGSPVVVHCGPGTGRTGTFIAVDMCMRMFEDRRRVDIMNCVHKMRSERAGAVQVKEQYTLVYQALNEYAVILSSPSISTRSSVITLHAML